MWISSGRAEQVFLVASSDTCSCKLLHHILVAPVTVTDRSFVTYITSVDSHCLLLVGCYHCVRSVCWPEEFVWWVLFYDQRAKNTWKPSIDVGERMGNRVTCADGRELWAWGKMFVGRFVIVVLWKGMGNERPEIQWSQCQCSGVSCSQWSVLFAGSVCISVPGTWILWVSSAPEILAPSGLTLFACCWLERFRLFFQHEGSELEVRLC